MRRFFSRAWRLLAKSYMQFAFAGAFYLVVEWLFRRLRSHQPPVPITFVLGGLAYLICVLIARIPLRGWLRYTVLPILGGGVLTLYEYLFGLFFLRVYATRLWDYSGMRVTDAEGLVSLRFAFAWAGMMLFALFLDAATERLLRNNELSYAAIFQKNG